MSKPNAAACLVITNLIGACSGLIQALRKQAQLARQMGGDIALWEGNFEAWKTAETAIAKAKEAIKDSGTS